MTTSEPAPTPEHLCSSHYNVKGLGTMRCLLVAPHPRYRHYAADPEREHRNFTWSDEQSVTLGRYRVRDVVRYTGTDERYVGLEGPVLDTWYEHSVPLVVELPGGPRGIGICLSDEAVELVRPARLIEVACTCAGALVETTAHEETCAISEQRWNDPKYVAQWEARQTS